jgi:hypothetical protein
MLLARSAVTARVDTMRGADVGACRTIMLVRPAGSADPQSRGDAPIEDQQWQSPAGDFPHGRPLDACSDETSDAIAHLPRPSPTPHSRQVKRMIRSQNCRKQALQIKVARIVAFAHQPHCADSSLNASYASNPRVLASMEVRPAR